MTWYPTRKRTLMAVAAVALGGAGAALAEESPHFISSKVTAKLVGENAQVCFKDEFGYKWRHDKDNNRWVKTEKLKDQEEPQVLFIERCLAFLKDGGRMAMVLPSGILGDEQQTYLRQYIQEKGHLFAIVELPFETFSPNVTINTSVLFIQKGKSDKKDIFISINEYCGHDAKGRARKETIYRSWLITLRAKTKMKITFSYNQFR